MSADPAGARRVRRTVDGMATDETTLPATEDEWRIRLSPAEFRVLREAGTEAPWTGEYVDTKTEGIYDCRACGAQLYPSDTKFDSHCGWPSFDDAIPGAVKEIEDRSAGMLRVEIRCARCDSHLGHVFRGEGFTSKNTRHCVNSLSIRLEPKKD
ncbi:peptide-methionine (R)-S-oxide reductase [Actinoplanes lutulentus]|uniref:peptide-methionine (R)-S-oxide reductase n=2 Tax=Actinoplanes lutulentus TaxID=1287878 RepID=A0A327Z7I0_9ACTN|nr:peptide-methionine (R)-S-oxide reductase [Actinoplanes lutulentus]